MRRSEAIVSRLLDAEGQPGDEAEKCLPVPPEEAEVNHFKWPPIVRRSHTSFQYDQGQKTRPPDEHFEFDIPAPAVNPIKPTQQRLALEAEEPAEPDPRSEIDRLLPTTQSRLRGNSMIHAPGVIKLAQMRWRERSKAAKKNGLDIIKAWQGLPEDHYLRILNNDRITIETDGDDAIITFRDY